MNIDHETSGRRMSVGAEDLSYDTVGGLNDAKVAIPKLSIRPSFGSASERHRVAHACEPCRQRKTKCSGERPNCAHCQNYGITCVYADNKREKSKQELHRLRGRVRMLENLVTQLEPRLDSASKMTATRAIGSFPGVRKSPSTGELENERFASKSPINSRHGPSATDYSLHSVDVLNTETCRGGNFRSCGYRGQNSDMVWIDGIRDNLARRDNNFLAGLLNVQYYEVDDVDPILDGPIDIYALPPQQVADHLVLTYFEVVHPFFPFLVRSTFMQQYEEFWIGSTSIKEDWLALLNIIFAIAYVYLDWRLNYSNQHTILARRSKALLMGLPKLGDITTVQSEALFAFYFMSSYRMNRAYMFAGLAVRSGIANGLHLRIVGDMSAHDKEARVRLWHSVLIVDQMVGATTGRPSGIPTYQCSVPLCQEEDLETLDGGNGVSERSPKPSGRAAIQIFNEKTKLSALLEELIAAVYSAGVAKRSWEDVVSQIEEFKTRLQEWRTALPHHLELETAGHNGNPINSRMDLALMYWNTMLLIGRPCVCRGRRISSGNTAQTDVSATQSAQRSVDAAQRTISLMYGLMPSLTKMLACSPWWILLHYLFSAGAVLAIAIVQGLTFDEKNCLGYLQKVTEVINVLQQTGNLAAQRANIIMENLITIAKSDQHSAALKIQLESPFLFSSLSDGLVMAKGSHSSDFMEVQGIRPTDTELRHPKG